jgi:hypothetical protein
MPEVTWKPGGGAPTPIRLLNTQHLFEILRFLIRRSYSSWQRVFTAAPAQAKEVLADGPIALAENGATFDAIMVELDRRDLNWQMLYDELRTYSRQVAQEELAPFLIPIFSESDP